MNTVPPVERLVLLALLSFASHAATGAPTASETAAPPEKPRVVIGRIEFVVLQDIHVKLKARIDTGAGVSSVDAKILEVKQTPDGERVRFQIKDGRGGTKTLERDVVDWANIKVMGTDQKNRRPIVKMDVCLGGKKLEGRINLTDRSQFLYPVLIGRNLLNTGKFLVDPGATYLQEPGCE
jgi:hypothetical protein